MSPPLKMPVVIDSGNHRTSATAVVLVDTEGAAAQVGQTQQHAPVLWPNGNVVQDLTTYGMAELQVSGLSGGDTVTVSRSIDGVNFVPQSYVATDFSSGLSISTPGIYSFPSGLLKWSKTGSASSPIITLRAGN